MATYKPKKKTDNNGTLEDVKFPVESVEGLSEVLDQIADSELIIDLGTITESPDSLTNTTLNKYTGTGRYVFSYAQKPYDMVTFASGNNLYGYQIITYFDRTTQKVIRRMWDAREGFTSIETSTLASIDDIPAVNDATLTIQKNGTSVGTFTANASSDVIANITVPTSTSQLTNNSDFATNSSVDEKIAGLVNSAPEALDTLGELATALETHEDAYDALLETVGKKANKSDINTLVARTEQEFNSFITVENAGKIISYNKKLYRVDVNSVTNPPKVGDIITELYFNTDITPDLSSVTDMPISIAQEDGTNKILVYNINSDRIVVYRIFSSGAATVYSNTGGWYIDHFIFEQPLTVSRTAEEDTWSNFISKTPVVDFAIAVEIGSEKANASDVQDEFKKKSIHFVSDSDIAVTSGSLTSSEKWTVNGVDGITEPFDGMMIAIRTPSRTLYSGTGTDFSIDGGAKYYSIIVNSDKLADQYGANITVFMTFNSSRSRWEIADVDKAVKYSNVTNASEYRVALRNGTGAGYNDNVTFNPSTGTLSATAFKENGVSLADKYALKDEVGGGSVVSITDIASFEIDDIPTIRGVDDGAGISVENKIAPLTKDGEYLDSIELNTYIPIIAGEGIEFKTDDYNQTVSINVTGGSGASGGQLLYRHDITLCEGSDHFDMGITIINTSSAVIDTIESVKNAVGLGTTINATGTYYGNSEGAVRSIAFFDNYMTVNYGLNSEHSDDYANFDVTINDTITEIGVAGGGSGSGTPLVETTYDELKALRDGGQLVAGQYYCITDYVCTTTQENTMATTNTSFNIIVQALSNRVLSENASACSKGGDKPTLIDSVITNKEVKSRVVVHYIEYVDYGAEAGLDADYRQGKDIFVDYDYVENNNSDTVPVIYKTDAKGVDPTKANYNNEFEGADYEDIFFYEGTAEIDGVIYDKWRLINEQEGLFTWASSNKSYVYTNQIVNNGLITIDDFLYEEETDEYRIDSSAVVLSYYEFVDSTYGYGLMTDEDKKFAAFEYLEDNNGNIVPVLHDWAFDGDTIGYNENYYYVGKANIDGQVYDKWRKIELDADSEDDFSWDTEGKAYYYTNVIVEEASSNSDIKYQSWEIKYSLDNDKTRFWWALDGQMIVNLESYFSNGTPLTRQPIFDGSCPAEQYNEYQYAWGTQADVEDDDAWDFVYSKTETLTNGETVFSTQTGGLEVAEVVSGKGVIYYMKDEHGNECPYDFKNIQFDREGTYYYTFSWVDENNAVKDLSIVGNTGLYNDEGQISGCYGNKMGVESFGVYVDNPTNLATMLNNNVFISTYSHDNGFFYGCHSNTFGDNCHSNTFGGDCHSNTFGNGCRRNTFGTGCSSNTFGNRCNYNVFGDYCSENFFGNMSGANTLGTDCSHNTFGNDCGNNTFGNNCFSNIVDNAVRYVDLTPDNARYVHIHSGVKGNYGSQKTITVTPNANFTQDVRTANDVTITV